VTGPPDPDQVGATRQAPASQAGSSGSVTQTNTSGVTVANTGVMGDLTVVVAAERFWTELFPVGSGVDVRGLPLSQLLAARHQVVAFDPRRDSDLATLAAWRDQAGPTQVRLLHGPGGQGKTRLAAEFAARSAEADWVAVRGRHVTDPKPPILPVTSITTPASIAFGPASTASGSAAAMAAGGPAGLLVIVDYAERWPLGDLQLLFTHPLLAQGLPTRVLLLARSAGWWWQSLRHTLTELDLQADDKPLGSLATGVDDRLAVFTAARNRFAQVLGVQDLEVLSPPGSLTDEVFGLVLALHMAALVAVDAHASGRVAPVAPAGLSRYLLDREAAHWARLHANQQLHTPPSVLARVVLIATLAGSLSHRDAVALLERVGLADGMAAAQTLLDDHRVCYPPVQPGGQLQPLYPDRLAEDFLAAQLPNPAAAGGAGRAGDPWAAGVLAPLLAPTSDGALPGYAGQVVAVLVETARRWPHVTSAYLDPVLNEQPGLAMAAGGRVLTVLAEIAPSALLERLEALLPDHRHVELDLAAAAITQRRANDVLPQTTDLAERAKLFDRLAWRLANAGLLPQALAAAEEAVGVYRRLVERNPAAYEPDLAGALNNLGICLSGLGRREEALAATEQAVGVYRRLVERNPAAYEPDLAGSLNNLGIRLSGLGRREEALAATQEAVEIRRRLVERNPAAYEPDLAHALWGFAWVRVGAEAQLDEALVAAQESVQRYQRLARAVPAAFTDDLLAVRGTLANVLDLLGRRGEAAEIRAQQVGS
jgi:tetratricopeptide (TPR) repeat protein